MKKLVMASIIAGCTLFGGIAVAATTTFTDKGWWTLAAEWANSKGLMTGMGDGSFGGDKYLTRGQMAQVLMNMDSQGLFGKTSAKDYDKEIADIRAEQLNRLNVTNDLYNKWDKVQKDVDSLKTDVKNLDIYPLEAKIKNEILNSGIDASIIDVTLGRTKEGHYTVTVVTPTGQTADLQQINQNYGKIITAVGKHLPNGGMGITYSGTVGGTAVTYTFLPK